MYRSGRFASRQRNWLLALTVFMTLLAGGSATQAQTLFTVTGDVATPLELSAADLAGMPREKATLEHDG